MMELIREDLAAIGIRQDVFFSERELHSDGRIDEVLDWLEERGLIYVGVLEPPKGKTPEDWEPRPQTLFKASEFGDDVDRPLRKSDGSYTYFAADIAYHFDKYKRGFKRQIDVWGADHGGYVKRMRAAVRAVSAGEAELDVRLCQLVRLLRDGKPARMSKRSGDFVTLRQLVEEVGRDVVRFIMLTRRNDAPLDFDLAKVLEQSKDNPVFYVQYAHARVRSVMRNAARELEGVDLSPEALAAVDLAQLVDSAELALVRLIARWPRTVEGSLLSRRGRCCGQSFRLWRDGGGDFRLGGFRSSRSGRPGRISSRLFVDAGDRSGVVFGFVYEAAMGSVAPLQGSQPARATGQILWRRSDSCRHH